MADRSAIEWTEATWNPVTGCSEVSPGCAHCYAKTFAERWRGIPEHPYEQGFDLRLWPERLEVPLRWKRPRTIFVNSMSDLFHEDIPDAYVAEIFRVMGEAHVYPAYSFNPGNESEPTRLNDRTNMGNTTSSNGKPNGPDIHPTPLG